MKQFVLPEDYKGEPTLSLRGDRFHHIVHVLRVGKGDTLFGIDRSNRIYSFDVLDVIKEKCTLRRRSGPQIQAKEHYITLFQCLLKGKKMDQVIRQATEAGVDRIVPVASEFSIPRHGDNPGKLDRFRRIALEAVEQSGAAAIPEILEPVVPGEIGELLDGDTVALYCHNDGEKAAVLHEKLSSPVKNIAIIIGPEGGLSEKDRSVLETAGFFPLYLGDTTLRSETAAVFALGAVHILLLEKDTWKHRSRL